VQFILPILAGYLLGSVSFSYLLAKLLKGVDIRHHGSGNAGATNTLRVIGVGPAIAVLVLDAAKGVLAVWLGRWITPDEPYVAALSGLAAVIGHNWPIFLGFRGGKGVATTIGVMATLAFLPALYAGIVAIAAIAVTRFVSLGSLIFALLLPVLAFALHYPPFIVWIGIIVCVFAFIRHRSNIVKLVQGKEHKLGTKYKSL
jgi:glycerol-3-phosphate acyltransferase PlsY